MKQTVKSILCETHIPIYEEIKEDTNPIFIWGAGALAHSVYGYCKKYGIQLEGVLVNVDVTEEMFEDLKIFSVSQIEENYNTISIIVGHSKYKEAHFFLDSFSICKNKYYLASPSYSQGIIPVEFIESNMQELYELYDILADNLSKETLKSYILSRSSDRPYHMYPYYTGMSFFLNDVLDLKQDGTYIDLGACVGNTVNEYISVMNNKGYEYNQIYAIEADPELYKTLALNTKNCSRVNVIQACIYSKAQKVKFISGAEAGGIREGEGDTLEILGCPLDELIPCTNNSIIKMNFADCVKEVLEGAKNYILNSHPSLIIRVGFKEETTLKCVSWIESICQGTYRYYMRYTLGYPQALTLFAIPN